jgi:Fe-S-cluster-containing dehydrogenase component/formate-dependent nitrite reductase membrane component NrfD
MRYGFIIDQRRCIGCHACTVACKQENGVALGDFRTWVKHTEKGTFPNVTRSFLVERCNHCDDAPCVNICPVTALYRRDDGIVDFSGERCIGCKACMAACPYDAIYIDPDTHTVGKCHYCSHRIDVGLQPACVNVCPVEAIITGDLDDPSSRIAQLLSLEPAVVRRPEKGTRPKLFYLGADEAAVNPEATDEQAMYLWGEPDPLRPLRESEGAGSTPGGMVQRSYSVSHRRPWGWHVSAYLWTKSISAGVLLVAAILFLIGGTSNQHSLLSLVAPLISLVFLAATNGLLVLDLERPERFWRVLFWPHWTSWLVIGGYILAAFGALVTIAGLVSLLGWTVAYRVLLWPASILAVAAACYTAFLLAQATGRDLWQSTVLPAHLAAQAVLAGAATLGILALALDRAASWPVGLVLALSLGVSLLLILAEVYLPHVTVHTRSAIRNMTRGEATLPFWGGAILAGTVTPLGLAAWGAAGGPASVVALAGVLALAGLALYETMYIRAGQSVPQS